MKRMITGRFLSRILFAAAVSLAAANGPAMAEDQPAAAAASDAAPAAAPVKKGRKPRASKTAAKPMASLESRHNVCLSFIQRHGLSCDPWVEPTCGADLGYFRPMECVRPRSQ